MAQPGLEPRTSHILCEHSDHWANEPHGWPVTISPCLIRFVPESARTMPEPTRQSLCCSQPEHAPTLSHQMSQGRKKHMAIPGLKPRTSRIPCEHSDHWATEPHGRPVTIVKNICIQGEKNRTQTYRKLCYGRNVLNHPNNNSWTYQIVSLVRFLHRLRLSPEKRNLLESRLLEKLKLNNF